MVKYNGTEIREQNGAWALTDVAKALGMTSGTIRKRVTDTSDGPQGRTGVPLVMATPVAIKQGLAGSTKKSVPPFLEWMGSIDADQFSYPVATEDAYAIAETMDEQLFDFGGHNVRVVLDESKEPWFVLKDVCDVLEVKAFHVSERIDERDKGIATTDTLGGKQQVTTVNESGLYDVIFQSRKPEAKRFRRWVTNEVLPAIRKTGAYITDSILDADDPWTLLEIALTEGKKLRDKVRAKEQELEAAQPAIDFHRWVGVSGKSIQVRDLAALISRNGVRMTQNQLFAELRERGFLVKNRRFGGFVNNPTIRSLDEGLLELVEYTFFDAYGNERYNTRTDVTPKGQGFFLNLFINEETVLEEVHA